MNTESRYFPRMVDILSPCSGWFMVMLEAYFDESGTHDRSNVTAIAGYILPSRQAVQMDKSWRSLVEKFNVPFLHMKDLAPGGKPFDHLTAEQRADLVTRAMNLIRKHTSQGFAVVVCPNRFDRSHGDLPDPYSFCAQACFLAVKAWMDQRKITGGANLFFEKGHKDSAKAIEVLEKTNELGGLCPSYTFARKSEVVLLQAADLLAWHTTKFIKDKVNGTRPPRKDFAYLMDHPHLLMFTFVSGSTISVSHAKSLSSGDVKYEKYLKAAFSTGISADALVAEFHRQQMTTISPRSY